MFESNWPVWLGIVLCLSQSATFSGLNLACFSVSRMRLEAEALHNPRAQIVLNMRRDSNFLLTTILWGNVAVNTLLALLSNSIMTGVVAFLFSTLIITFFGEICPQAYFSRKALQTAARFAPLLRFYQILLWPLARPTASMLDLWLGRESVQYMREKTLRNIILRHIESDDAEIAAVEGLGALNFLDLDDMLASGEGQPVKASSVIALPSHNGELELPVIALDGGHQLLEQINAGKVKWVILTDTTGHPRLILNADEFIRDLVFAEEPLALAKYCHQPIVFTDSATPLGDVIAQIKYLHKDDESEPLQRDVALLWSGEHKRVITGSDILADLLRGLHKPRAPNLTADIQS